MLSDEMWAQIEPVLPPVKGAMGRPMRDHRLLVEGAIYRYRTGVAWRDLPAEFGPWQTVWKRHHRFSTDGTWDKVLSALQVQADARGEIDWRVSVDSTIVAGSSARRDRGEVCRAGPAPTQGARSNYKNPPDRGDEPDDHAIGRSRGGLTTKTHALVDGNGLPLVIAVTPGQANDSPALPKLLAELRVPRIGPGRPRTTPQALRADKAYSARGSPRAPALTGHHRGDPRALRPDPAPQEQGLTRRPARRLRRQDYKNRNVVERAFNHLKNWRGLATRYDKHALVYRGGVVLAAIMLWLA